MEGTLSPADVAVLSGNRSGDGFGDGSGWWIIVFLIFALGGFGRNGFGGGFGGGSGIADNYVLATDFATIERKLDSVNSGICDATFALNNTINNGFFGVQNSLTQGFSGLNTALLQGNYALSSQLAECCCGTQRAIDGVNYNIATNTCAITNAINNATRDIVDSQNANYRAIHEELVANKLEAKNDRIAEQQNEINALRLKASQEAQNNYLISQLRPCPDPAYIVPNPNCCYDYTVTRNGCGCNNGCY
jgi:hypothetical protein